MPARAAEEPRRREVEPALFLPLSEKRTPERRIHRGNFAIISGNRQPAQLVISAMQKSSKI